MKHTTTWMKWIGAGAIVLTGVAGCGNDKNGNGSVADEAANSVAGTADNVSQAGSNMASGAANVASKADDVASNMATGAAKTVKGALNTGNVKTAIMASPAMAGSNINVTTKNNMVMLEGTVKSAAQKTMAGKVAMKEAGAGYKVMNNLKMGGGKMSGGKMSGKKM